ncbi:MAG: hypothetical protein HN348_21690 [Proteobacteria bacterium]|nr:hypothetical protein [Pseudomonadota bacterium]
MNRVFLLGTVKTTKDPEKLGRIQVELPHFSKPILTPFLRLMVPYTGDSSGKSGWVFLPEKGDEVIVLCPSFGETLLPDDLAQAVVLGVLYNGKDRKPIYSNDDDKNCKRQLITKKGHGFAFDDEKKTILITCIDDKTSIFMDADKKEIIIKVGKSTIKMAEKKIEITTDADGMKLVTKGDMTIESKKSITIKGKGIKIDAQSKPCDIKGKAVNIC